MLKMKYNAENGKGKIWFAKMHYPDMFTVIDLFMRVDPRVMEIQTIVGGKPDTKYSRRDTGWKVTVTR